MSHSKTMNVKLPPDLAEAAALRAASLGYQSLSAYVKGLLRYDLIVQGGHAVTLPVAAMSAAKQDSIDSKLLDITKRGVGERGQLLEAILKRIGPNPGGVGKELADRSGE